LNYAGALLTGIPPLAVPDQTGAVLFEASAPRCIYFGLSRHSNLSIEASFGDELVNSEIALATSISEMGRPEADKSPSSNPRRILL
jgi:hypothetical protein